MLIVNMDGIRIYNEQQLWVIHFVELVEWWWLSDLCFNCFNFTAFLLGSCNEFQELLGVVARWQETWFLGVAVDLVNFRTSWTKPTTCCSHLPWSQKTGRPLTDSNGNKGVFIVGSFLKSRLILTQNRQNNNWITKVRD